MSVYGTGSYCFMHLYIDWTMLHTSLVTWHVNLYKIVLKRLPLHEPHKFNALGRYPCANNPNLMPCIAVENAEEMKKNKLGLICTNHSMGFCWFFRRGFFFPSFPPPSWLWRSVFPVINFCVLEGRGECVHTEGPTTLLATSYNFA